jgi:putative phosphoesterase
VSTQLGLISDPHAAPAALEHALSVFKQRNIDTMICAGDIAGYFDELAQTVQLLKKHNVHCIIGNHDQDFLTGNQDPVTEEYRFLQQLPATLNLIIESTRIAVMHAQPPDELHGGIKLLDINGRVIPERKAQWNLELHNVDYDILIVGHTHQLFAEQFDECLVINPGSTAFNHSAMILTLPERTIEVIALENRAIVKCWNWGKFARGQ